MTTEATADEEQRYGGGAWHSQAWGASRKGDYGGGAEAPSLRMDETRAAHASILNRRL
jgi:hypothetical protein